MGKSKLWYLLPILLSWLGGLIMWLVLRHDEPNMAKNGLIIGVVVTVIAILPTLFLL